MHTKASGSTEPALKTMQHSSLPMADTCKHCRMEVPTCSRKISDFQMANSVHGVVGQPLFTGGNNACFIFHKTAEQSVMSCSDITLVVVVGRLKSGALLLK